MRETSGRHQARGCFSSEGGEDTRARSEDHVQVPDNRDRVIAIVGPTAVGKTELAMRLAQRVPVEIIGADSRQVYRHMDIGTAKPSVEQRASVTHHLVDIIDPCHDFSLGEYIYEAKLAIRNANNTEKLPILVGGTGQYVMALLEGWNVPAVQADPALRTRLEADFAANGIERLVEELRGVDPEAHGSVDLRNSRRVIRAIERAVAGHPRGAQPAREEPSFESIWIGLNTDRAELYARADRRLDSMMASGFLEEVEWLLASGYSPELPAMSGIGYSELADHLLSGAELQDVVQKAKFRTHRYIRQQSNWFRASDTRIHWFGSSDIDSAIEFALSMIQTPENCHNQ